MRLWFSYGSHKKCTVSLHSTERLVVTETKYPLWGNDKSLNITWLYISLQRVRMIYIYIYIHTHTHTHTHTFQRDTQCSCTDCLLILRCQLYMCRTVTVHPQELLCRCCMCRLWYVLICPAGTTFEEEVKFVWSSSIILNFSLVDNYQRFAATCCLHIQNCASFNLKQQAAGSSQKLLIIYQITWNG